MYKLGDKVWFIGRVWFEQKRIVMTDSEGNLWHRYDHPVKFEDQVFSGFITGIETKRFIGTFLDETSENDSVCYQVACKIRNESFVIYNEAEAFNSEEAAQNYLQSK